MKTSWKKILSKDRRKSRFHKKIAEKQISYFMKNSQKKPFCEKIAVKNADIVKRLPKNTYCKKIIKRRFCLKKKSQKITEKLKSCKMIMEKTETYWKDCNVDFREKIEKICWFCEDVAEITLISFLKIAGGKKSKFREKITKKDSMKNKNFVNRSWIKCKFHKKIEEKTQFCQKSMEVKMHNYN